jgi:plastocyanin
VTALLPVAALSVAACGSDGKGSSDSTAPANGAALTVVAVDGLRWEKDAYSATAGDVAVTIDNESSQPHTLAILDAGGTQIGGVLETTGKNDTETGTFTLAAGSYTIICTIPGHGTMKAGLTVS